MKSPISKGSAGATAIRLSTGFIIVEILLWLAIGICKTYLAGKANFNYEILSYVADNFGNLIVGAATTAYVIFTYYLLESTEASRKRSAEPLLKRLGTSEADILRSYPTLRAEDLANAWAYVRAHREEINKQIEENEAA